MVNNIKMRKVFLFIHFPLFQGYYEASKERTIRPLGPLIELRFKALFKKQKRLLLVFVEEDSCESESIFGVNLSMIESFVISLFGPPLV